MREHTKQYSNLEDFRKASIAMDHYQKIHNLIRLDYIELLRILENSKENENEFNALYRASLKSLFTIIEADIYGLNNIDSYPDYSDRDSFENKLKKTFKQVCNTWQKPELNTEYFNGKYANLKVLRKKRDEIIHPKKTEHIHKATEEEFNKLKQGFTDYDNFINALMDKFYIGVKIDSLDLLKQNRS
jgi:hypothetical protein